MLKNKFKIIALFMVIILTLMIPIVRADDNEANTQNSQEQAVINAAEEKAEQSTNAQDTYRQGDVYLTGDEVTIDYIVDGNLFVFADTVNITSQIGGDAFIVANTINISESGYIFSNLFAIAPNVNISGSVYDVYTYSNNLNISGYIFRDVRSISNDFILSGTIGRNAFLKVNNIQVETSSTEENSITSQGSISGNLNYSATQEITIPDGIVLGDINYTQITNSSPSIQSYILALGKFLVTVIIIWLLCLWLTPKFVNQTDLILTNKLPSTICFGILTPIAIMIASVIFLLLGITSSIAVLSLIILFIAYAISSSIFVITINNLICKKLKVEKLISKLGFLILIAVILWLIALIPFIGKVISIIAAILGLGILINGILPSNRNKNFSENKKVKTEKLKKEPKNEKSKKENK